jgi:hypothetical protein
MLPVRTRERKPAACETLATFTIPYTVSAAHQGLTPTCDCILPLLCCRYRAMLNRSATSESPE